MLPLADHNPIHVRPVLTYLFIALNVVMFAGQLLGPYGFDWSVYAMGFIPARLLGEVAPVAADALGEVEAASVGVVTLAFAADDVPDLVGTGSSGFLVPPVEGRAIKASTFSFAKWAWVREAGAGAGVVHLRTSLGRHGDEAALQAPDERLVEVSLADLRAALGLRARPVDTHVQRWGGGLPQYAVGHLTRVARVRAAVAEVPGLAVCGAAYDGVGIPAVIGSARLAVRALSPH